MKQTEQQNWSERIAASMLTRKPDINPIRKWEYEDGLVLDGIFQVWQETGDAKYFDYVKHNIDLFVDADGNIANYSVNEFNIDHLNNGKIILELYKATKEEKYRKAADLLHSQLEHHPRTSEGAFWHKEIYPYQVWLDGLYMGSVFYIKYLVEALQTNDVSDVIKQFEVCQKHTYDAKTGLNYHAWDEKRQQPWADKETGLSPNFWSRSIGWYLMALVDTIAYLQEGSKEQEILLAIYRPLVEAVEKMRDRKTGLWYQVTDMPLARGNYLESSGSGMILYALAKGVRLGYLDGSLKEEVIKTYDEAVLEFLTVTNEGLVNVNKMCYVAGLGGAQKRDGSYAYYISEPIVTNDNKGIGAILLASVQVELLRAGK